MQNNFHIKTDAISENESFLRNVVATFALPLSPTLEQISDIKTAISEAVTNCVVHAYHKNGGEIHLDCSVCDRLMEISIRDFGCGIPDIKKATQPFFTTKENEERAGLGFTLISALTDEMTVENCEVGLLVKIKKQF
ncbi:MAG: anti-sigma F factor [Bacillota bacterium]